MTNITLICHVLGEDPENIFSFNIDKGLMVSELKETIKEKRDNLFSKTDAALIKLWRVDIPFDVENNRLTVLKSKNASIDIAEALNGTKIQPGYDIEEYFNVSPPKKRIHIIVEPPIIPRQKHGMSRQPSQEADIETAKRQKIQDDYNETVAAGQAASGPSTGSIPRDRIEGSTLVLSKEKFQDFPVDALNDYSLLRTQPEYAYFDRTGYISVLDSIRHPALLFLRPRRFGKSLTLSMLAHFHGVEHRERYAELFSNLDVDKDVQAGKVTPGQYLMLSLDFSAINRSADVKVAEYDLQQMLNNSIKQFYSTYARYLGNRSSEELIERLVNPESATSSLKECVRVVQEKLRAVQKDDDNAPLAGVKGIYLLADECDAFGNEYLNPEDRANWNYIHKNSLLKGFWGSVKSNLGEFQITKCFITGVSPLSMTDLTSGFNVAKNISDSPALSGLCGFSREDVIAALKLPEVCGLQNEVEDRFNTMETFFNGYRFSSIAQVPRVFNTNTCLEYFQSLIDKEPPKRDNPSNSEVSETTLKLLASSHIVQDILERTASDSITDNKWRTKIPYLSLKDMFRFEDLMRVRDSKQEWLSYMRYIGGLTYADDMPNKHLQFPNFIAFKRFGAATLDRYDLNEDDIVDAIGKIAANGDVSGLLNCYQKMMSRRDVTEADFNNSEERHRDNIFYPLLKNPVLLQAYPEYIVTKPSGGGGRVDLLIEAPSTNRAALLEFKVIRIPYVNINPAGASGPNQTSNFLKALALSYMSEAETILDLKFPPYDKYRPNQRIGDWIETQKPQLVNYWESTQISELRQRRDVIAYLVLIIGSRKILFWQLNEDGKSWSAPQLVTA
ncbi:5264_t:CDS:2 [Paraglomus occultum]|uniref:5264_t:CDS:1 n=1 Tax=Paraglomus occultum TaxID=144539 RepID=A0A9N8VBU9_9GLOM|nr:5264_t:CDS:2 [Paraglomus occultum]